MASYEAKSLILKGWAKLTGLHRAECSARHQTQEKGRPKEEDGLNKGKIRGFIGLSCFFLLNPETFFRMGSIIIFEFSSMSRL